MPAPLSLPLQEADRSISAMRERIITERRQILELQKHGYNAVGYITVLRELENALRLMQSRREAIVSKLRRREQSNGAKKIPSSRR
jgi:hypothetical protein